MLLRRITEHVKAQNWTAVALDFLIVVVGVFVGIQVSNWNESRQFDDREKELLRALRTEIERSIDATNQKINALEQVGGAGARSLAFLESGETCMPDCWRRVVDFIHASQWQNVWVSRSTFDELRRVGLPRSRIVIDAVDAYHAQNQTLAATLMNSPAYRDLVRGLTPLQLQDVYWAECYKIVGGVESYSRDCLSDIDQEVSRAAVEDIAANPDIVPTLTAWTAYVRAMPPTLRGQIRAAEKAIALINDELKQN